MKEIILLGTKKSRKTELFLKELIKNKTKINEKKVIIPIVNYGETIINYWNNKYKIIDIPGDFFQKIPRISSHKKNDSKERNSIENKKEKIIEELFDDNKREIIWFIDIKKNENKEEIIRINKFLKKKSKKISLIVNDFDKEENELIKKIIFSVKKKGEVFFFSSLISNNFESLLEKMNSLEKIKLNKKEKKISKNDEKTDLDISIIGPPNTGKSTLMNMILKKNRSVISEIKGTTKERVLGYSNLGEKNFKLIDSAGADQKKNLDFGLLRESDLVLFVIDASDEINKRILNTLDFVNNLKKSVIIIINKIDLIKKKDKKKIREELKRRIKSMKNYPIILISALKKEYKKKIIQQIEKIISESKIKINKKKANEFLEELNNANINSWKMKKKVKFYFLKHEFRKKHIFIFFINDEKKNIHFSKLRFIENKIRESFLIENSPIEIIFKNSKK